MIQWLASLLTFWMPVRRVRRSWRDALVLSAVHRSLESRFRSLIGSGRRIRLAFFVVKDSTITFAPLIRRAAADCRFDVSVIVIPDVCHGHDNQVRQCRLALAACEREFGKFCRVRSAYDEGSDAFVDVSDDCDMVVLNCPYPGMTHRLHSARYLAERGVLPAFVSYGFFVSRFAVEETFHAEAFDYCWRVFADTPENLEDLRAVSKVGGRNLRLTGFCRMDDFVFPERNAALERRRRIIIAPHHTVAGSELQLSNFLRYADFFLALPARYPNIDWVFRPHPLLFVTLRNSGRWDESRIAAYKAALAKIPKLTYEDGGPYIETFGSSDAMIHDCGSFLAEYLYTNRPVCFMVRADVPPEKVLSGLGMSCLGASYLAHDEAEILAFVDDVILGGRDPMAEKRLRIARQSLAINHPDVAGVQLGMLKGELA